MSGAATGMRAIAFGTPDGGVWGAALQAGAQAFIAGSGDRGAGVADPILWTVEEDGAWRLTGDSLELTVEPLEPPAPPTAGDGDSEGGSAVEAVGAGPPAGPELCRVRGHLPGLAGGELAAAVGVRAARTAPRSAKDAPSSVRFVAAWFAGGAALGLLAARPRRGRHQDADTVTAGLFDSRQWIAVTEPRLSTTYDAAGTPRRMNLELWVGDGEHEYLRRAGGEAAGAGGSQRAAGLELQVVPLTCHSRDETGAGVYVLGTF